jgi:hypothetical protein
VLRSKGCDLEVVGGWGSYKLSPRISIAEGPCQRGTAWQFAHGAAASRAMRDARRPSWRDGGAHFDSEAMLMTPPCCIASSSRGLLRLWWWLGASASATRALASCWSCWSPWWIRS